jgi:hypothetical protein
MKKFFLQSVLVLLFLFLAACSPAAGPAAPAQTVTETPGAGNEVPSTGIDLSGLDPQAVLLQMDYEPTFALPQYTYPFGRVPNFTLLADGTVIYTDTHNNNQVMQAQLTPQEAAALVQQVWDLGFGEIESHRDFCIDRGGGEQECVADASFTILRALSETGELREISNYANFSNNPAAYQAITDMLTFYANPTAQAYQPEGATLFIQPEPETYGETALEWPLDAALLTNPPAAPLNFWAYALEGDQVNQYLAAAGNAERRFFEHEGQFYSAHLIPWLPGADFTQAIQAEFPQ